METSSRGTTQALAVGLGTTHNKPLTFPRLATLIASVEPDVPVAAVEAVAKLQCDYGDRSDRKHARMKYLVEEKGAEGTAKATARAVALAVHSRRRDLCLRSRSPTSRAAHACKV